MYKLSSLPMEIVYMICDFLEIEDVVTLARLNSWYSYRLSIVLSERINQLVNHEGWRIHIDILAKSYPFKPKMYSRLPYSTELLLLGEYARINPYTLTIEFSLCPIDEEGLDPMEGATQNERSIVLFNQIKTNIDIVAYFAQITSTRKLQSVNHAGGAIMNDKNLWEHFSINQHYSGVAVMGSGFNVQYDMSKPQTSQDKLVDGYTLNYNKHFKEVCSIENEQPSIISFDRIRVSPEWWIKQLKVPNNLEPDYSEIGFW